MHVPKTPNKIICLTEESVELLYLLGLEDKIIGVSQFAVRPDRVKSKPVVSVFTHANLKKIASLDADLIIGYSDIQKDIARDLIEMGQNVWVSNHRSLNEVIDYCSTLSHMLGAEKKFEKIYARWCEKIEKARTFSESLKKRPRVYLEEWDEPQISGIRYFSELVELCGAEDINRDLRTGFLAKDRFTSDEDIAGKDPEFIFGCWCGKKVDLPSIKERLSEVSACKSDQVFELPPEIFLQPGPALFEDGIDYLIDLFSRELR